MDDARLSTTSALIDDALHVHGNSLVFGDAQAPVKTS